MVDWFRPRRRLFESRSWYVLSTAGPRILDVEVEAYLQEHDDLVVYPSRYFYPSPWSETRVAERRAAGARLDSYAIHHCRGSWITPTSRLLRRYHDWRARVRPGGHEPGDSKTQDRA
jgi:hypothetical protein